MSKMVRDMILAGCVALLLIMMMPYGAFAQQGVWTVPQPERMWAVTDIQHIGPLSINRDYSHSYSADSIIEERTHSFNANVSAGNSNTRIFDVFSVAPTIRGSRLFVNTIIGYNPLNMNTSARLMGSESTYIGDSYNSNSELCAPAVRVCGVMGSQFDLKRGVVHSTTSTNTPMSLASYDFSSTGEGTVSTGFTVVSGSGDAQTSYSQRIKVEGEFERVDYSASFNPQ